MTLIDGLIIFIVDQGTRPEILGSGVPCIGRGMGACIDSMLFSNEHIQ